MTLLPAAATAPAEDPAAPVKEVKAGLVVRDDPEAIEVARLVNEEGWDQWTASYLVHTGLMPPPIPPPWDAGPAAHSTWVRAHVRALFTPFARKVGLR